MSDTKQKFQKHDLVRIAKDLGKSMSHFTNDCDAVVLYSYADKYGHGAHDKYALYLKGHGFSAWYYEHQLSLIKKHQKGLKKQWKKKAKKLEKLESDLDWIFERGKQDTYSGSTVSALAECFGLTNLWGSRGEGVTYYMNSLATIDLAAPFLDKHDKEGWLAYCDERQAMI